MKRYQHAARTARKTTARPSWHDGVDGRSRDEWRLPGYASLQDQATRASVCREFVWDAHMGALEKASREGNFAVSFRAAGAATLAALARGAAAKGHNILEKTIRKESICSAYGVGSPGAEVVLEAVRDAGIEGYVGHWDSAGLAGLYLSGEREDDAFIYPLDVSALEDSLVALKRHENWQTLPFTGDYDTHDMITFRGAGRPRSVLTGAEERTIIDRINREVARVDPNRPFHVRQRNVVRHGPQVNFLSYMVDQEAEQVRARAGVLGAVARAGAFPVAFVNRGAWSIIGDIDALERYYTSVGARIKESWKPGGVRFFAPSGPTDTGIVRLARRPYPD
ncbi:hypothetical protein [Paraburkholderia aspalathi]|uniref:hypothetical protein n=1 Tax=Paraburkholderia aspalathi TaxID=1324617 RepID=UPI0038BDCD3C